MRRLSIAIVAIIIVIIAAAAITTLSAKEEPDDGSPVGTLTYDCYYFIFSDYTQINYNVEAHKKFNFDPELIKWERPDG